MKSAVKRAALIAAILFLPFPASVSAAHSIPVGTVLPVRLNSTLSSAGSHAGQVITARLMQDVPLPGGANLRAGAKIIGHIVNVAAASPAGISIQFDTVQTHGEKIPIATNLRAIASFVAVEWAQIPDMGPDRGTPEYAWTTTQIGGDVVYRGGGHVEGINGRVGEPTDGGVLSQVYANPERGCPGSMNASDAFQALWVFSSDACGAYGFSNLTIRRAGPTDPIGQIIFDATAGQVKIRAGAGLLLRVNASGVSGA
jgi:hypothetical protein